MLFLTELIGLVSLTSSVGGWAVDPAARPPQTVTTVDSGAQCGSRSLRREQGCGACS
jgi:hypothetical protein